MGGDWRPTVPDMMTECPVCREALFDDLGIAANGDVAKIPCHHLVHNECLRRTARSLNSDGAARYGIGWMGQPRAGCPICHQEATMWACCDCAAAFPVFWMKRIQHCLETIGPEDGPVAIARIRDALMDDPGLTVAQKEYLIQKRGEWIGFEGGLAGGNEIVVHEDVDGGIANGGYVKMYCRPNVWHWDKLNDTLWLHKWDRKSRPKPAIKPKGGSPTKYATTTKSVAFNPEVTIHEIPPKKRADSSEWWVWASLIALLAIVASLFLDNGKEITW